MSMDAGNKIRRFGIGLLGAVLIAGGGATPARAERPDVLWLKSSQGMLHREEPTGSVGFSPDGKYFAFTHQTFTEIRRASDLKLLFTLPVTHYHLDPLSVVFRPDSRTLLTGKHYRDVRHEFKVWRMEDGQLLNAFRIDHDHLFTFGNGRYAVTTDYFFGTMSRTLRFWSLSDGRPLFTREEVRWWELSPDADTVTLFFSDGRIQVLRTADGSLVREEPGAHDRAALFQGADAASLSPSGDYLLVQKGGRTVLLRSEDGSLVREISGTTHAIFSPGGEGLFLYRPDGAEYYGIAEGRSLQSFPEVKRVRFSPGNRLLITEYESYKVAYWRESGGGWARAFPGIVSPSLLFSRDGSLLAVPGSAEEPVRVYRVSDEQVVREFPSGVPLDISSDNETLALALPPDPDRSRNVNFYPITFWRISDGTQIADPDPYKGARSLAFSPDGQILAVGGEEIQLRSARDGILLLSWPSEGSTGRLSFSADGVTLRGESADKVREWRVADGTLLSERDRHTDLLSPDGRLSVGISPTYPWQALIIRRAGERAPIQTLAAEGVNLRPVAFTPDSRALVVSALGRTDAMGNQLRTFELWSVEQGRLLHTLASVPLRSSLEVRNVDSDGRILTYVTVEEVLTDARREARFTLSVVRVSDGTLLHSGVFREPHFSANLFQVIDLEHDIYVTFHRDDHQLRLWKLSTGEILQNFTLREGLDWPLSAEFTPDRRVLILKDTHRVSFWDIATGQRLREFDQEVSLLRSLTFSPEGQYMAYTQLDRVLVMAANPLTPLSGDVNDDRTVEVGDAVLTLRFIVELETPTPRQRQAADMDRDERITVGDVVLILRKVIGLPD